MEIKFSYECSELIEKLENDIKEFGDIDMYAYFKKIEGHMVLFKYDFIKEELSSNMLHDDVIIQILKASTILEALENQNSIL